MPGYTDYCTCFYEPASQTVFFYDELTDCFIMKQPVNNQTEAETLMQSWIRNAPENSICHLIE